MLINFLSFKNSALQPSIYNTIIKVILLLSIFAAAVNLLAIFGQIIYNIIRIIRAKGFLSKFLAEKFIRQISFVRESDWRTK